MLGFEVEVDNVNLTCLL